VKQALLVLGLTAAFVLVLGVWAWSPWASKEREREVDWLRAYVAWSERIDETLERGDDGAALECQRTYAGDVGAPPSRLVDAGSLAVEGCRRLRAVLERPERMGALREWRGVRDLVLRDLTERRARIAAVEPSRELAAYAAPLAGRPLEAFCWSDRQWSELNEEWRLIDIDELWLLGYADAARGRIHLAPSVCESLHRFFGGNYAPNLNDASSALATALVVLGHEAEHLRSPTAPEHAVECVALQRVRNLVRAAGRPASYADLMAGLAWDVGYPAMPPEYRTAECHDGSGLDVRPDTTVWP
jgi:hypothetical protein